MNEIEKRELIEQQRKILETGTQRADRRSGFFSFLTWPFFIAPLFASEDFLAATQKSRAGEPEDSKAHSASLSLQAANTPASDPSKTSAENETAREPSASSLQHTAQFDPPGSLSQSDHVPKLGAEHSEVAAVATVSGAGRDNGDFCHHDTQTSIDDSSIKSLSADSNFEGGQGGSTPETLQSNGLSDLLSPSTTGSAALVGAVSGLSNNVIATSTLIEPLVQPALATASDALGTLTHDVVGTIAPVEAAVQPVLATASDALGTLTHDVVGTIAPVEAAVQPVLATASDALGTLTHDVVGTIAPVEAAVQPVLATASDALGTLTHDVVGTMATAETDVQPVLATASDALGTLTHDVVGTMATAETDVQPVLANATDSLSVPIHDVPHSADSGNVAGDALGNPVDITEPVLGSIAQSHSNAATDSLQPVVADAGSDHSAGVAETLLALATATDAPIQISGSAAVGSSNGVTSGSNATAVGHSSAIAGDVIALNDASTPPENALFSGNQYTNYGVALSSDIAVPSQHAGLPADSVSAHDALVPAAADVEKQAPPPPDIVDTTHPIDHLGHAML